MNLYLYKYLRRCFILVALSYFLHAHLTLAADRPDCSRTLTLAYHDHGMLYSKESDQGIDKDVALEMMRRSGCKFEISAMPRSRIWLWIESGKLDFSMSGITNSNRDQYADFAWYLYNKYYFLTRKDTNINSLSEFKKNPELYIGAIRSFRYSKQFNLFVDYLTQNKRIIEVSDHSQLLNMIKQNHIQGMIIEPFNYSQVDSSMLNEITRTLETDDKPVLHGVIMSKKSLPENERKKWKTIIDDIVKDGTMLKILKNYFDDDMAKSMVNF